MTKDRLRLWIVLIASYIFYGWWDYRFLLLIWALTLINYYCGYLIGRLKNKRNKKIALLVSIFSSLSILGFFKYYNFFAENITVLLNLIGLGSGYNFVNIILPVGISFYVFQTLSYTIDVYNKKMSSEPSLLNFSVFVAFFPQLVAGPIVRASEFLPQISSDRIVKSSDAIDAVYLILWGFFLKIVIADSLANVVDIRFNNIEAQSSLSMLIGVIFYSFQIYGDFAGYSLIAIGIARLFGFRFPINFDRPYFSTDFSDFWRRWHISLSSWLRDYLYIPMGGGRGSAVNKSRNLMITMLLGGLWHGASWNFIVWGGLHGAYQVFQNTMPNNIQFKLQKLVKTFKILAVYSVITLTWIFFRSSNFDESISVIWKIFDFAEYSFASVSEKFYVVKGAFLILVLITLEFFSFRINALKMGRDSPLFLTISMSCLIVFIALFGTFESNSFIYFQF